MPDQARGKILELRQLDLHLAFMALRAQRKNIQDQHGAVDHARLDSGSQIAHLRGGKIVIEYDQRSFMLLDDGGDFIHLAAAANSEDRDAGACLPPAPRMHTRRSPPAGATLPGFPHNPAHNYYDLLASEARITSIIAIAKGEIPQSHWMQLGRPVTRIEGSYILLSWSGTIVRIPDAAIIFTIISWHIIGRKHSWCSIAPNLIWKIT